MSTKMDQLVTWCRTSNVIPASGTKARNDLADMVMGQPVEDIKAAFKVFRDEPDSVKRWVWLVTNVCDFESGIDLIYRTVLSYKWYLLQIEHEEEITKGWFEINEANRKIASQLREIDAREMRMTATVNDLKVANNRIEDLLQTIRYLTDEVGELREIEAECNVYRQALRHGLWRQKPLTTQRVLDQYAEAVSCARDLTCGYPDDEIRKPVYEVIADAVSLFTEIGTPPDNLAEMVSGWRLPQPDYEEATQ